MPDILLIHSEGVGEEDQGKSGKNDVCEAVQVRNKSEDSVFKMFHFSFKLQSQLQVIAFLLQISLSFGIFNIKERQV